MEPIIDFADGLTFGAFSYPDTTAGSKLIVQIDAAGRRAVAAAVLSLANTAVPLGTYPKVTVDAKVASQQARRQPPPACPPPPMSLATS